MGLAMFLAGAASAQQITAASCIDPTTRYDHGGLGDGVEWGALRLEISDGQIEIAYGDRPHLDKTLRIWRYVDGKLRHVADNPGLTNHQIGWDVILGGLRDCGDGPEMILSSGDWSTVMAARLTHGQVTTRRLGPYEGPDRLTVATTCP